VELADLKPPSGTLLWEVDVPAPNAEVPAQRQRLWADGARRLLEFDGTPVIEVDVETDTIRHADWPHATLVQVVAAVAMPILVGRHGGDVFHGSASSIDGRATLLLGPSGAGKSSLLVALAEAGHAPITEDACVVSYGSGPQIWPGPPWVRLGLDVAAPDGWRTHFDAPDKRGWALDRQPDAPVAVGRVVLLEPATSGEPRWESVPVGDAVAALAQHVTWLGAPGERMAGSFQAAVRLARAVPVHVLRLPHEAEWTARGVATLAG
jgi:hypothetical protein